MNKKESEIINSALKKIKNKYHDAFNQCKLSNSKITTFYSLKKNFSDISFRKTELKLKENKNNKIFGKNQKLKLDSIFKRIKKNSDLNLKKISIENIMNIQSQRLLSNNNSIDNSSKSHRNLMIDNLLNKRISKLNSSKSPKLKMDETDIIEKIKKDYGENIFLEKYEKSFQQKERPIKYYLKKINRKLQIHTKLRKNIKSINLYNKNNNDFKDNFYRKINWPVYETIEFRDQKIIYANKLIIEDKSSREDFKNNIGESLSCNRINSRYLSRYLTKKLNKMNNIKNFNELKIKNFKELEKMKKDNFININNSIIKNREIIEANRNKYKSFLEKMSKKFNKYVEEICKNDL